MMSYTEHVELKRRTPYSYMMSSLALDNALDNFFFVMYIGCRSFLSPWCRVRIRVQARASSRDFHLSTQERERERAHMGKEVYEGGRSEDLWVCVLGSLGRPPTSLSMPSKLGPLFGSFQKQFSLQLGDNFLYYLARL